VLAWAIATATSAVATTAASATISATTTTSAVATTISSAVATSAVTATISAATISTTVASTTISTAVAVTTVACCAFGSCKWGQFAFLKDFAFEEPYLDPDLAIDSQGFYPCVVYVRAEGVQGRTALFGFFRTRDLGTTQTTAYTDLDTFCSCAHGALDGSLDGTAEVDAGLDLLGDLLTNDVGIQFGFADLKDVDLYVLAGQYFELFFDEIDFLASLADDDARAAGMYRHGYALERTLYGDPGDAVLDRLVAIAWIGSSCLLAASHQVLADFFVLYYFKTVVFVSVPVGVPTPNDAQAVADRICFLTHCELSNE
jgi:hypothetical protein